MKRIVGTSVVALLTVVLATSAEAQATRTWVSGVGDDANPCSRTAPCKTFAGAISKTASGGEIDALDPGGFGAVTITKPITLDGAGTMASILASGTNGVIISSTMSPSNGQVILRNLSINGAGTALGLNGIRALGGGALYIENCVIFGFSQLGVDFQPNVASFLFINNSSFLRNLGGGVRVLATTALARRAAISGSHFEGNSFGVRVETTVAGNFAFGSVKSSIATGSAGAGFITSGSGSQMILLESIATANATGIQADAGTVIRAVNSVSSLNTTADTSGTVNNTGSFFGTP